MPVWGSQWVAQLVDRRTGARRATHVSVMREGLEVERAEGSFEVWPYAQVEMGLESVEGVEFARGGEAVRVPDKGIVDVIRHVAPETRARFRSSSASKIWGLMAVVLVVMVVGVVLAWKAIGWVGEWAALAAPESVERKIGEMAFPQVAPESLSCSQADLNSFLRGVVKRLDAGREYELRVVDSSDVNAVTLPGGFIAVYRGLLRKADTAEEVAGVLAHEVQHARGRHSMKAMGRQFAIWMLIGLVTGGADVASAQLAGAAGALRYQREDELEADLRGLEMLRAARISSAGMESFFAKLAETDGEIPWLASQFSTHPDVRERVRRVRDWRGANSYALRELMAPEQWRSLRAVCR